MIYTEVDCRGCDNYCCKSHLNGGLLVSGLKLREEERRDIERNLQNLGLDIEISDYLPLIDGLCPFYRHKKCIIHSSKPKVCKLYPILKNEDSFLWIDTSCKSKRIRIHTDKEVYELSFRKENLVDGLVKLNRAGFNIFTIESRNRIVER